MGLAEERELVVHLLFTPLTNLLILLNCLGGTLQQSYYTAKIAVVTLTDGGQSCFQSGDVVKGLLFW